MEYLPSQQKHSWGRFLLVLHLTPVVANPKPLVCRVQVEVAFLKVQVQVEVQVCFQTVEIFLL